MPFKKADRPVDKQALSDTTKKRSFMKHSDTRGGMDKGKKNNNQDMDYKSDLVDKKKKIDFKAKAIKAKENSVKKVIAKGMKGGGGPGGDNSNSNNKNK